MTTRNIPKLFSVEMLCEIVNFYTIFGESAAFSRGRDTTTNRKKNTHHLAELIANFSQPKRNNLVDSERSSVCLQRTLGIVFILRDEEFCSTKM